MANFNKLQTLAMARPVGFSKLFVVYPIITLNTGSCNRDQLKIPANRFGFYSSLQPRYAGNYLTTSQALDRGHTVEGEKTLNSTCFIRRLRSKCARSYVLYRRAEPCRAPRLKLCHDSAASAGSGVHEFAFQPSPRLRRVDDEPAGQFKRSYTSKQYECNCPFSWKQYFESNISGLQIENRCLLVEVTSSDALLRTTNEMRHIQDYDNNNFAFSHSFILCFVHLICVFENRNLSQVS